MAIERKVEIPLNPFAARQAAPKPVDPIPKKAVPVATKATASAAGRKRGPKPSGAAKKLISLRLDQDVIEGYRLTGNGWQSRLNAALRRDLGI